MGKKNAQYRAAYVALRMLALDYKRARAFQADKLARKAGKSQPGFAEWAAVRAEESAMPFGMASALTALIAGMNEIDRLIDGEAN